MRFLVLVAVLFSAAPCWCSDDFGLITGLKGTVLLKRGDGARMSLSQGKHLMRVLREGEEISTGGDGSAKIASLQGNALFELSPSSAAKVQGGVLKTLRGKVAARKGFPVPKRIGDASIGAVVLSSTLRAPQGGCLEHVTPLNTAVAGEVHRISWKDECSQQPVSVTVADPAGKIVFSGSTTRAAVDLPAGALQPGIRYTLTLQPVGAEGRVTGFLRTLDREEVAELEAHRGAARSADQSGKVEFLLYLMANELYQEAKEEAVQMQAADPRNHYLRGVTRYLAAYW